MSSISSRSSSSRSENSCKSSSSSSSSDSSDNEIHSTVSELDQLHLEESNDVATTDNVSHVSLFSEASVASKGANKDYIPIKTYPSLLAAKDGIGKREICDQFWTRGMSYSTQQGDKICYSCRGNPKCPKRMQILLDPASQEVHVSVSSDEHSHGLFSRRTRLNPESRDKVLELLANGVSKPRRILKLLEEANLPCLSRIQINNLKQRLLHKTTGPLTCSLSEFLLWVKAREDVPDDEDKPYVVSYSYKLSKTKKSKIKDLRCFLTTRRLITQALKSNCAGYS